MLEPGRRRLFLDALRPPDGYSFDLAVGTTYTLDLMALLAVPLAFTFRDAQDRDGHLATDPLALLESARRHAGNIVLFCHGGGTSVPRSRQPALAFLRQPRPASGAPAQVGGRVHLRVRVRPGDARQPALSSGADTQGQARKVP